MDLIYTDKRRQDVGVLNDYTFDLAFGADENDFELTLDAENHCCDANCLLYIENTEYGGIIDGIGVVTGSEQLRYFGRTWQGIFASKIIEPDEGEAYLTVSGDANEIIGDLIERCGLSELFVAPKSPSGLTIESYQFDRYVDAYSGLKKMLEFVNWKLRFSFVGQAVLVSALPAVDYSQGEQFDSAGAEMSIEKRKNNTNHLICLGKGAAAGWAAGIVFQMLAKKSGFWASIAAAAVAPVANTGLFILGGLTLVSGTLEANLAAFGADSVLIFLVIGCAGINFLVEFGINMVLSPAIYRIISVLRKKVVR